MIICGIDPGISNGGIAFFRGTAQSVEVKKMPREITDFADLMDYYNNLDEMIVFIETVQLRKDDFIVRPGEEPGGKMFRIEKMLTHFHEVRAYLKIRKIKFVPIYPITWQSDLKLRAGHKNEEPTDRKNRYKAVSQSLFKTIKVTLWSSDALLIMEAGRRKLLIDPTWVNDRIWNQADTKLF